MTAKAKRHPGGLGAYLTSLAQKLKAGGLSDPSGQRIAVELEELIALRQEVKAARSKPGLGVFSLEQCRRMAAAIKGRGEGNRARET